MKETILNFLSNLGVKILYYNFEENSANIFVSVVNRSTCIELENLCNKSGYKYVLTATLFNSQPTIIINILKI